MALERSPPRHASRQARRLLRRDGGLVIDRLVPADVVDRLEHRPRPARSLPASRASAPTTTTPSTARTPCGSRASPAKSRDLRRASTCSHPTLLAVADRVLLPNCGDYWMSQSETIFIGPGNAGQELHRDDLNWNLAAQLGSTCRSRCWSRSATTTPRWARRSWSRAATAGRSTGRSTLRCRRRSSSSPAPRSSTSAACVHGGGANLTDRPLAQGAVPVVPRGLAHARGGRPLRCRCRRRPYVAAPRAVSSSASPGYPTRATDDPAEAALRCGSSTPTTPRSSTAPSATAEVRQYPFRGPRAAACGPRLAPAARACRRGPRSGCRSSPRSRR